MITLERVIPSLDTGTRRLRTDDQLDFQRLESVLLIEDDEELSTILSRRFRKAGLVVARAFDGVSGLEMHRRIHPDVVVLDLGLPQMSGAKVLHHLRMDPGMRQAPVLVITGSENEVLIQKACNWGVHSVLRKPVSPRALVSAAVDALEGL